MNVIFLHPSIELLTAALVKAGYSYETKELGGANHTLFTSPAGESWLTSNNRVSYPSNTGTARNICANKHVAYDLAHDLGVATPKTVVIDKDQTLKPALIKDILKSAPLIVKPDKASLSYGLTLQITIESQLLEAIEKARQHSDTVLAQKQLAWEEIRFVVVDGIATAAILRQTPRVIGDGAHTITELIALENAERQKLKMPYLSYPQLKTPLIDLTAIDGAAIPEEHTVVELGRSTMVRGGASMYDVLAEVHGSYIQTAQKLANTLGNGFTVVDMFVSDYRHPQTAMNYAFNEFNTSPVLIMFYSCRDSKHYDVLSDLVPLIDRAIHTKAGSSKVVLSNLEMVAMPNLGLANIVAKVDTGAYSGALDCLDIQQVTVGDEQLSGIRFRLAGCPDQPIETTDFVQKYVRSATGHRVKRYLINTTIVVKAKTYPITIGLSDRSKLKYPVLLGRRFLRENGMLVDVRAKKSLGKKDTKVTKESL